MMALEVLMYPRGTTIGHGGVNSPAGVPGHSVGRTNYCRQHHDRHYSGVGTADHPGSVGAADLEPAAVSDTDADVAYGEGDDSDVDRHNANVATHKSVFIDDISRRLGQWIGGT